MMKLVLRRSISPPRIAALLGGFTAIGVAVTPPLAHLDHHLLTAHMVQHLLLMLVAAPLILLGAHSLWAHSPGAHTALLRWSPHAALCWIAGTFTVVLWHVPAVFALALRSSAWHDFEQATFFIAGIFFWTPAVTRPARWLVPFYLFLGTLPCDALSAFLVFNGHVVYRHYASGPGLFGLSPLEDQALAGALMWVLVTFAYMVPALVVTTQLLTSERSRVAEFVF